MKTTSLTLLCALLIACGQAPPPLVNQTPKEQEQREAQDRLSITPSDSGQDSAQLSATTFPSASAAPAASMPQFANQSATEGARAYVAAFAELKNQPPPPATIGQDAISNPASVTGSLNMLAAKINALSRAKQQVEANLSGSEELRRWQQLEKTLGEGQQ